MVHRSPDAGTDCDVIGSRRLRSKSGASTTQTNDQADSSIWPVRRPISSRAAPSSAREEFGAPAAKKTQSPGAAPTCSARPAFSVSDRFLATGPLSSPSSPTSTYASPRAPRCLAQSCQASSVLRGWAAPPGITTAPTYGAWKTRNSVAEKYAVQSVSSEPKRRSGLSEP